MPNAKKWLSGLFLATLCAAAVAPAALADPAVTGITPGRAPMQSFVTIYGSGFGYSQGTGYVTLGGRPVPVLAWSDSAIHVVINPMKFDNKAMALDTTYPVQVIMQRGTELSNTIDFTLTTQSVETFADVVDPMTLSDQPTFECFQKPMFCRGDNVIFYGSGFGSTQGAGYVTINVPVLVGGNVVHQDFALPVTLWSENAIDITLDLPNNVVPGVWTITVHRANGKTASGSLNGGLLSNGNCDGGTPKVSLSRNYISFADICTGKTVGPLCFTITNTGTGPLIINSIKVINCSSSVDPHYIDCATVAGFQIVSGGDPGTLAPNQSRDVCMTFTPEEAATFDGRVSISTNASSSPDIVQLHGTGDRCTGPEASVSPNYMSFADLKINTTRTLCFTVTNTGSAPLHINNISILNCSNSVEPHYVDCTTVAGLAVVSGQGPATLAVGASRQVCISFTPHEAATFDATVMIASDSIGGPVTVALHGTGDK
jgi:hypothetical protein